MAESVTKGAEGVTKQQTDRKLLPSSWSIRKKNLAPASYRAAYQGQHSEAADLAPHAGSTGSSPPLAGGAASRAAEGQGAAAVGSGWQVACSGRLSVEGAGAERSVSAAGRSAGARASEHRPAVV